MSSRPLTEVEINQILSNMGSVMHKCLFVLGIRTGFRISELLSLEVSGVLCNTSIVNEISVKRRDMKGKKSGRTVVLHNQAKAILQEYLETNLVSGKLFPLSRFAAHRVIKNAAHKAGLAGRISTHSMRKTFGMKVYERTGKDIVAAQKALGHKSLASTSHYLSVDQDIVDNAILSD